VFPYGDGKFFELGRRVAGIIDARRAVKAVVDEPGIPGKVNSCGYRGRVGDDASYLKFAEHCHGALSEPGWMPRFEDNRPVRIKLSNRSQKSSDPRFVEALTRRKLKEEWAQFATEILNLVQKRLKLSWNENQGALVSDKPWNFNGEAKVGRRGGGPPGIGRRPVLTVKGRINLDAGKHFGVSLEMRTAA
jgi:hypothetical protein